MTKGRRTTLRDVAACAGVSTGTASLVLNGSKLVAQSTRERVLQAIRELDYVYDRGAAQLRSRRTKIVGLSICNLINPYFAEVAAGIENTLNDVGYAVLMGNCSESVAKQGRFLDNLREYNVEGILMMPAADTKAEDIARFLEWDQPLVMVSRYVQGVDLDYAGPDNRNAAAAATRHLIELGHRDIGYIGLNNKTTSGRDRAAGFRLAMRTARLAADPALMVECADSRDDGFRAIQKLFHGPHKPTGVVCFDDLIAFGTMLGLRDLGLVPGKDCSVIGHGDVAEAALWRPPLTTVAVDAEGVGIAAAELLRMRIDGLGRTPQRWVQKTSVVIRATCGPP